LPQENLASIRVGLQVRVTFEGSGDAAEGKISAVDPTIDPTTRNVKIRAAIPEEQKAKLRPGMFVNVSVVQPTKQAVVAVPLTAIVHASYGDSVFVIRTEEAGLAGHDPDARRQTREDRAPAVRAPRSDAR
jgi:membrane fusion protein (multidrug efflux system)